MSSSLILVSFITTSLPWGYWAKAINTCHDYDCECILFGKAFADQFTGGRVIYCQTITLLHVPLFLISSFMCFYQGRRAYIFRRQRLRIKYGKQCEKNPIILKCRTLLSRSGRIIKEGDIIMEEKEIEMEPPSYKWCITLIVVSSLFLILLCCVYVLHVVGYYWSCNEYRIMLIKLLKASGNMAQIFSERLECRAVYSFMDYLQPKRNLQDSQDYERKYKINTGLSLFIAQMVLLKNIFVWVCVSIVNILHE
ncbi:hypothetical protein Phum_PHUM285610 [Pediculus humanus corporis]|uniref:Uncharacterized protein n=1 Tax=Pediculus humanus subsp. corporis TaxID=121224 RepID=E0VLB9_PEDHC|nr:uncharacterized protein Phum_PHUM285610 [Pediculus humanus corporis]EEB14175.1 hypothetical protein Phum_PHUM285610 [Pediculus humanus corporis]